MQQNGCYLLPCVKLIQNIFFFNNDCTQEQKTIPFRLTTPVQLHGQIGLHRAQLSKFYGAERWTCRRIWEFKD